MRWPVLALFCLTLHAQSLNDKIQAALAEFPATVNIAAKNLTTGATYSLHADQPVRTASTIKLPILAATFAAVAEGKLAWTDLSTLHDSDKVTGTGVLTEFTDGDRLPLVDLAHLMIVLSDNTATNLVLDRVTADYVNAQMDKLGLAHTRCMRKVIGKSGPDGLSKAGRDPANEKYGLGSTTPLEMIALLEKLHHGEVVSKEASQEILAILKRQQDHNGIARRMPDGTVANKAGALDHLRADVGIITTKSGPIAMAIYCDDIPEINWTSDNPGLLMIAKLSEILVSDLSSLRN